MQNCNRDRLLEFRIACGVVEKTQYRERTMHRLLHRVGYMLFFPENTTTFKSASVQRSETHEPFIAPTLKVLEQILLPSSMGKIIEPPPQYICEKYVCVLYVLERTYSIVLYCTVLFSFMLYISAHLK